MAFPIKITSKIATSAPLLSDPVVSPDDVTMNTDISHSHKQSRSIPITNPLHRTPSEIQLCEDEALADYRDYCMYARITRGIQKRQACQDIDLIYENDACLANIRRTRAQQDPEECSSLKTRHDDLLHMLLNPSLKTTRDFLTQAQSVVVPPVEEEQDDEEIFVIDF